jgi:hypothetical protein
MNDHRIIRTDHAEPCGACDTIIPTAAPAIVYLDGNGRLYCSHYCATTGQRVRSFLRMDGRQLEEVQRWNGEPELYKGPAGLARCPSCGAPFRREPWSCTNEKTICTSCDPAYDRAQGEG